jgi:hypothetical protein
MRRHIPVVSLGLVLALAGCQDLAVTNPNLPDRGRVTEQPASVEALVASAFRTWWPATHDDYPAWAVATVADEVTSGFADFGHLELSAEPRPAWNNSPVNSNSSVNEDPWYETYSTLSSVNDALIAIDGGLVIEDEDQTARARAVGKFMQGLSHGLLGLLFDQAFIVNEHVDVDTVTAPTFHPYAEVLDTAIAELDESIAIASSSDFELPPDSWLFVEMTSDDLARLANSFAARFMVYGARTRAEREAVDWAEVVRRVDAGIQVDFAPIAQPDVFEDDWKRLLARVRTASRPSDFGRPDNWLVGPADSSDAFINWVNTPVADRRGFQLVTKDRRIQGPAGPSDPGTYYGYNRNDIFRVDRGTYRYSWYYFHRFGTGNSWQEGPQPAVTVAEMHLLKAEALIRLNRAEEAVPLINETRVANGQLPPVTIDGPPDEPGCVPRKLDGQCGSLWDALRYEKRIEGMGVDATTAFFDARGWQTLVENSITQLPVPGRELETLGMDNYTFGGPGGQSSAPPADPERCPVALPRCPA